MYERQRGQTWDTNCVRTSATREGTDVGQTLCECQPHEGDRRGTKIVRVRQPRGGDRRGTKIVCVFLCTKYKDKSEGTHNSYALVPNHSEKHGKQCVGTHVAYSCMCTCVFDKL